VAEYTKHLLRLSTDLKNELNRLAEEDNRNLTNYIVTILEEHVKHKESQETHNMIKDRRVPYNSESLSDEDMEDIVDSLTDLIRDKIKKSMKYTSNK
jgi:hypothetical protein